MTLRFVTHRTTTAALAICVALWAYCYVSLDSVSIVGGDAGQWVTLARFYIGEAVPAYMNPSLYPPIYPLLQALSLTVVGDVPLAVNLLGAMVFAFASFSFFVAGRELWSNRAGLLALMLGSLGQYFIIYFTAFGGFPQILSLGLANFVVGCFAAIYRSRHVFLSQWAILSLLLAFSFFTYAPLMPNLVAILSLPFILMMCKEKKRQSLNAKHYIVALLILSIPFIAYGLYASSRVSELTNYATNDAAFHQRGLEQVLFTLFRHTESALVVIAGVFATIASLVWTLFRRKEESFGFLFTSWWLISIVSIMCCLYLLRVGTDYVHGYTNLIVVPLVLNVAGLVSKMLDRSWSNTSILNKARRFHGNIGTWGLVTVLLSISIFLFPATHSFYVKALDYYSISAPEDLIRAIEAIENMTSKYDTVLTTPREGKWLEAFVGQAGLYIFPEQFSFRSWEHSRSMAADVLFTSSLGIENGLVLVKYQEVYGGSMFHPMISVYHHGEYVEAVKLENSLTEVRLTKSDGETLSIPFQSFRRLSTEMILELDFVRIVSRYNAECEPAVQIEKTVEVRADDGNVSVVFKIETDEGSRLESVSIGLLRSWGDIVLKVGGNSQELQIIHNEGEAESSGFGHSSKQRVVRCLTEVSGAGSKNTVIAQTEANKLETTRVSEEGGEVTFTPLRGHHAICWQTLFRNEASMADIRITVSTTPASRQPQISGFQLYSAEELLEVYQIRAVLLPKDFSMHSRRTNLEYLGFTSVYENDSYIVLMLT